MQRVGYWIFLALAVAMAVVAIALGITRVIEGEMLYALSNTVGVLALAALLYGGAAYFRASGGDKGPQPGAGDEAGDADVEARGAGDTGDTERVDHIDQAAQAEEEGQPS